MTLLSTQQAGPRTLSSRSAAAQQGPGQQPMPRPLNGRVLVGQLGVGRHYPATGVSLLIPRRLSPLPASAFDFERLRADAQRLQQRLAAHDRQAAAPVARRTPAVPAPRPAPRPTYPGSPSPVLSADERAQRKRERKALEKRLLDDFNDLSKALYLPPFLRGALADPVGNLRVAPTLPAGGRDCFMPASFWKSQNPFNDPKVGWAQCCNTVKKMVGYNSDIKDRIQLVREQGKTLVGQATATKGLAMLDKYMALHKPVMAGVHHRFASGYNKAAPDYQTTDHFVAIVGMGTDKKGRKYYRFFDVGTTNEHRKNGIDERNRLYYDPNTKMYSGKSIVNGKIYTLTQLRFKPGTF